MSYHTSTTRNGQPYPTKLASSSGKMLASEKGWSQLSTITTGEDGPNPLYPSFPSPSHQSVTATTLPDPSPSTPVLFCSPRGRHGTIIWKAKLHGNYHRVQKKWDIPTFQKLSSYTNEETDSSYSMQKPIYGWPILPPSIIRRS